MPPAGARFHRPRQDHQVRRLLSRPCRFACSSRPAAARSRTAAGQRRGAGRFRGADDLPSVQRHRSRPRGVSRERERRSRPSSWNRSRPTPAFIFRSENFLEALREECTQDGALLIFDEVMTGFRVARGGAQEIFGIRPDLTALGKVIGGGLPVGAFGGRAEIMDQLSPRRSGLPGRNAFRQSARDGRRAGPAPRTGADRWLEPTARNCGRAASKRRRAKRSGY